MFETRIFGVYVVVTWSPRNPWDVGRGVKLTPVLKPQGCHNRRAWCFHRRGQDSYGGSSSWCLEAGIVAIYRHPKKGNTRLPTRRPYSFEGPTLHFLLGGSSHDLEVVVAMVIVSPLRIGLWDRAKQPFHGL